MRNARPRPALRFVIIGAGMSGILTAIKLREAGYGVALVAPEQGMFRGSDAVVALRSFAHVFVLHSHVFHCVHSKWRPFHGEHLKWQTSFDAEHVRTGLG